MAIRHYVLLATDGFIEVAATPDICQLQGTRRKIYIFGFTGGLYKVDGKMINPILDWKNSRYRDILRGFSGRASIPSPIIWGEVGDLIYITLINLGMEYRKDKMCSHTVHIHGSNTPAQLDGVLETSFGVHRWTTEAIPPTVTYLFQPEHPGTYMYQCHVEAAEHVQMGMFGALVVYPSMQSLLEAGIARSESGKWFYRGMPQYHIAPTATNRNFAYNDVNTYFAKEYVMLLSDIDSRWHDAVLKNERFNAVHFRPDYWLINGRSFPDTLLPHPQSITATNDLSLTQIDYESYVHVKTGELLLLRMINMGYESVPWYVHGYDFVVIGKDTHPSPFLKLSSPFGIMQYELMERSFTVAIASGQSYELLLHADDKESTYNSYMLKGQDGLPSLCTQIKELNSVAASNIAGIAAEPVFCPAPKAYSYTDVCGQNDEDQKNNFSPQFYTMENHIGYKATNNGIYPGGQLTFIQVDAPL